MRVLFQLTGLSGMVMHNPRLIDPEDPIVRAIKEITDKGSKQTDADRAEVGRLEWLGGLYHDPEIGVYVPTWNILKCFNRGGVVTRQGTDVLRALSVFTDRVPLIYDGPKSLEDLYAKPEYRFRKEVGIGQKKVMRVRPIFRKWSLKMEAELLVGVMNPEDMLRIAETGGMTSGLGDARVLGFGRFSVEMLTS